MLFFDNNNRSGTHIFQKKKEKTIVFKASQFEESDVPTTHHIHSTLNEHYIFLLQKLYLPARIHANLRSIFPYIYALCRVNGYLKFRYLAINTINIILVYFHMKLCDHPK